MAVDVAGHHEERLAVVPILLGGRHVADDQAEDAARLAGAHLIGEHAAGDEAVRVGRELAQNLVRLLSGEPDCREIDLVIELVRHLGLQQGQARQDPG